MRGGMGNGLRPRAARRLEPTSKGGKGAVGGRLTLRKPLVYSHGIGLEDNAMTTTTHLLIATLVLAFFAGPAEAASSRYSKQVQRACANDYRRHCSAYGIETSALRLCMKRARKSLSKGCVNALVAAGEVSRGEGKRRKRVR